MFGVCLVLVMAGSGLAANSYTDLKGRFALDLPEGWSMNSGSAEGLFVFEGGSGETMILMYDEEAKDIDKLVQSAAEIFKGRHLWRFKQPGPVDSRSGPDMGLEP